MVLSFLTSESFPAALQYFRNRLDAVWLKEARNISMISQSIYARNFYTTKIIIDKWLYKSFLTFLPCLLLFSPRVSPSSLSSPYSLLSLSPFFSPSSLQLQILPFSEVLCMHVRCSYACDIYLIQGPHRYCPVIYLQTH